MKPTNESWIGVDLDGTLAHNTGWQGADHIGAVVPEMLLRIQNWLNQGIKVKIFTSRAAIPQQIPPVREWLREQGLPELEVTNVKDMFMVECWDDRAVEIITNTGRPANPLRRMVSSQQPSPGYP